jgi:hypothetical protein
MNALAVDGMRDLPAASDHGSGRLALTGLARVRLVTVMHVCVR